MVDKSTGTRSEERVATPKPRELYYANHLDACVYGFYAKKLNKIYDGKLRDYDLNSVVTAYRSIRLDPDNEGSVHKSSADFASEVFSYILKHKEDHLVAITFDIKGFFDNLNHKLLKKAWYQVMDKITLPEAEYNIFKNITNFSYINENQLFNEFKDQIIVESKTGIQKLKKIKKFHHLKNQRAIAFCDLSDLERIKAKNLIVANGTTKHPKRIKGIPQGSPISAVLANVYMLNFDKKINDKISNLKGIYRRYSDDMIVICQQRHANEIKKLFNTEIRERDLEIQPDKTQVFEFKREDKRFHCAQQYESTLYPHKNLEYLGFEFDGFNSFLKSSSLSSFYRKMKRSVKRSQYYSKTLNASKSKGLIFKTRLYKKFSYLGAGRRRIYVKDKTDPNKWIQTERHNWGNYISYAQLAMNKLPNNKIKSQIKRHWKILNKLIN